MIWSLKQQAPVAEIQARIVFVQLPEGKPADLVKIGGVYADLYNGLVKRHQRSNMLAEKWKREHPQTKKILKSSL